MYVAFCYAASPSILPESMLLPLDILLPQLAAPPGPGQSGLTSPLGHDVASIPGHASPPGHDAIPSPPGMLLSYACHSTLGMLLSQK
jgi:hypothetical protein